MIKPYDYLIVGAGLFGAVFANELKKKNYKCLVIDKRSHIGGNTYCETIEDIVVHKYGAHIFHTNDEKIWNYVNQFIKFNQYRHSVLADYQGELFNLPFNMNTFYQLWKVKTPREALEKLKQQQCSSDAESNLENKALSLVGTDIYYKLIKGYTEKQWGKAATELPASIIQRIPIRMTFCNDYFDDRYQGIPVGGYNTLFSALLRDVNVQLNVDYFSNQYDLKSLAQNIVFTGPIDAYYNYSFGRLEYRTLEFDHQVVNTENYQGAAVVNYTDKTVPFTRIIEHKHFEYGKQRHSVITFEYPKEFKQNDEPYYQNRCFRAANLIASHLYIQEMIKDFFYLTEEIQYKLADISKNPMGIFTRSKTNTTARMVYDRFKGEIPTDILGCLNNTIQAVFSKEKADYWQGLKSLKNFKKDIPIPLPVKCISKMRYDPEKKAFCFNMFAIPVKTYLGRDYTDKRLIMERLLREEIKLCTSQIQLKDRKIYWLAAFEFEKEEHLLKPEIIAEASLSLEHPIVAKTGNIRINIGSKEEFLYRRLAIQASQRRIQNGIAYARSGK
ncbi:UDP-galactopyranose mutase [Elizabethkingia anophelis]|uniref:UDP-galactopyranose mutase n=1 Tax=Elizabethkingia anophelis TaxID=1117645 RepID=UPI00320A98CA